MAHHPFLSSSNPHKALSSHQISTLCSCLFFLVVFFSTLLPTGLNQCHQSPVSCQECGALLWSMGYTVVVTAQKTMNRLFSPSSPGLPLLPLCGSPSPSMTEYLDAQSENHRDSYRTPRCRARLSEPESCGLKHFCLCIRPQNNYRAFSVA